MRLKFKPSVYCRWLLGAFKALEAVATSLARHGRGMMPRSVCEPMEVHYLAYRECYNSPSA